MTAKKIMTVKVKVIMFRPAILSASAVYLFKIIAVF